MAEKMTTYEKIQAVAVMLSLFAFFTYHLCLAVIFPYVAVIKAEKGDFKETCAYVVGKRDTKYSYRFIVMMDGKYYDDTDIMPIQNNSPLKTEEWNNFPINKKQRDFFKIEPNICKKVKYIEAFNKFDYKQIYLYDYLNQP